MLSRRSFVGTSARVACALPLVGSWLARSLEGAPVMSTALPSNLFSGLSWRLLGPFRGGRVDAVSGVIGRPNEFYFGHVNGGVWKSIDAGRVWEPIFDDMPVASIGALAVAGDVVYVGSGESTLRDSAGYGNGVYKSIDGGKTWAHLGLDETHHIGRIAIDPKNPDVAFVAAIGKLYAPNPERGVFRTRDGGRTWQRVLHKNDDVGAVDVVIDPGNSQVIYAGLWNTRRPPWFTYAPTNGPGGGIYKSTDGGETWMQLTNGLPAEGIGRTGIAVCPSDPKRVYAVVDCLPDKGGFFRSDDAGATWTMLSNDPVLWGRGWYFEKVAVDPFDADVVYVPNVAVNRSMDGGKSWQVLRGSPGGDDYHQMWISPDDTNTIIVASDQGCIITRNAKAVDPRDVTWSSWLNQPTAQLYHLSVDYRFPYWVTAAQQDSGAVAVRSRGKFAEISMRDWEPIGAGGESGMTAGDPLNPGVIFGGSGTRYDLAQNRPIPTSQPRVPEGEKARADWTQPLVLSKADAHNLYYANQYLYKSSDAAKTWTMISPDLTQPKEFIPPTLDATAAAQVDRNGKRGVIYAIAPSPLQAPVLWVGTDDGLIHLTPDDGRTWQNVTPRAVTPWSRITMIDASHFDVRSAYASVDRHQLQDYAPYIYRTRDSGKSWQLITRGLPADVYVHTVKEDPKRRGLLFCGTERGVFVSFDDGDSWQPLQLNLPVTSMRDLEIYENDLIVATHGRGFWVIDDISPLRQIDATIAQQPAFLFQPADAIAYSNGRDNGTPFQKDEPQAENPMEGAAIDFYLRDDATVKLEVLDSSGAVMRAFGADALTVTGRTGGTPTVSPLWQPSPKPFPSTAGMHRVYWVPVRPAAAAGQGGGGVFGAPRVQMTGTFTARLTVNGQTYTRTFNVKPDPRPLG